MANKPNKKSDERKLEELIETTEDLKKDYKRNKKMLKNSRAIRNLKIFGSSLSLAIPFCIAGSIISTAFYFLGAGFPIIKDEDKNYKKYTYECEDGIIDITESYDGGTNFDYNYGNTKFDVYSDWVLEDGKYTRTIKTYKEHNLTNMNLYNSVVDKNIEYIENNCVPKKERIEETNDLDLVSKDNGVKIEGIVTCINDDEYLTIQESDRKNKYTTFVVACFTILIGIIANRKRRKKVKENIKHYIKEHRDFKILVRKEKNIIIENENKIKALGKWVNKNEKK
jgi:hypothetical protein